MYNAAYILHIAGLALWIGSFVAFGYLLRSLVKSSYGLENITPVLARIRRWVNIGMVPSAIVVMATGVFMIIQLNRETLPFYLLFMEQAGSMVILITVIMVSIYSRKLRKKLQGLPMKKEQSLETLSLHYTNYLFGSASLAMLIVIVVGLRIS
ncbi:hypothetical protein FLK61_23560 [Paenalkalicoccus suaedae]|uniref:Copper resistance protein D domain-containing protein n=1 Tax=Paenalkalicoccus suaedae TaxID=2592382 RepID=A0A859FK12_9BACI|nr:hypothetical protein [Paenalkalicoccus suaedae]QKS73133.1 hypothetical protein FLK61_23560 [Paenalkalicoccus suaedae]